MTTKLDIWNMATELVEKWYNEKEDAGWENKKFEIDYPKKELDELLSKLTPDSTPEELYKDHTEYDYKLSYHNLMLGGINKATTDVVNGFFSRGVSLPSPDNIIGEYNPTNVKTELLFLYGFISAEQCLDELHSMSKNYIKIKHIGKDIKKGIVFSIGEDQ